MQLRAYREVDAEALAQIYFDAVRIGAAPKYSAEQLAAWAPARPRAADWHARLTGLATIVACDPAPIGFMSLRPDGLLDLAFVTPARRGSGVADALHAAVVTLARSMDLTLLTTDASRMARPFFIRMGWQEIAAQQVVRSGVSIQNFRMTLNLPSDVADQHAALPT